MPLEDGLLPGARRMIVIRATVGQLSAEVPPTTPGPACEGQRTETVTGGPDDDRPKWIRAMGVPQERLDVVRMPLPDAEAAALALSCAADVSLSHVRAVWHDGLLSEVTTSPEVPCVDHRAAVVFADVPVGLEGYDTVSCGLEVPLRTRP